MVTTVEAGLLYGQTLESESLVVETCDTWTRVSRRGSTLFSTLFHCFSPVLF